jgi:hypothetical protein
MDLVSNHKNRLADIQRDLGMELQVGPGIHLGHISYITGFYKIVLIVRGRFPISSNLFLFRIMYA